MFLPDKTYRKDDESNVLMIEAEKKSGKWDLYNATCQWLRKKKKNHSKIKNWQTNRKK